MRTLQEKYNAVLEGNYSKAEFLRDAKTSQPQFITQYNSYDDAIQILKNKGMIAEAKVQEPKYSTAKPEDTIAPDVLDTGIKFELDKKYGTLDVTDEQYAKCREMAIKNLANDVLYYVKQDSVQLETPGEKMEKAVVKEEVSKEEAWKEYQEKRHVTDKTIAAAEKDFNKGWEEGKFRDGNYMAEEVDPKATVAKMIPIIQDYLANGGDRGAARDIMDDLKNGRNLHVYADIESVEDLKDQLDYEYSYSDDLSDLEEGHGENPEKFKEADAFDPTKFYIKDLKSGRILNAVSVQGSKLILHYDTEADAQAQADWITRWEGDPGRFEVLPGTDPEVEALVSKQTGTGEKEKSFFEKRLDKMRAQQDLKEEGGLEELFGMGGADISKLFTNKVNRNEQPATSMQDLGVPANGFAIADMDNKNFARQFKGLDPQGGVIPNMFKDAKTAQAVINALLKTNNALGMNKLSKNLKAVQNTGAAVNEQQLKELFKKIITKVITE